MVHFSNTLMHLSCKSITVVFSNKNQSSTRNHLFVCKHLDALLLPTRIILCMALMLLYYSCYTVCDLYVEVTLINFSGYFIQVHLVTYFPLLLCWCCLTSNSACGMSISTCVWLYKCKCTLASPCTLGVDVLCFCFMFPLNRSKARSTLCSLPAQCLCTRMHKFSVLFLHVSVLGL